MPKSVYTEAMSRIKQAGKGRVLSGNRVMSLVHHMQAEIESLDRRINKLIKVMKDEDEDYLSQLMDWQDDLVPIATCVHQLVYDIERDATALKFSSDDEDMDDVVDLEEEEEELSEDDEPDSDDLDFIAPEGPVEPEAETDYEEDTDTIESDEY